MRSSRLPGSRSRRVRGRLGIYIGMWVSYDSFIIFRGNTGYILYRSLLTDIQSFVQAEQARPFFKAMWTQDTRIEDIDACYRRIGVVADAFQVNKPKGPLRGPSILMWAAPFCSMRSVDNIKRQAGIGYKVCTLPKRQRNPGCGYKGFDILNHPYDYSLVARLIRFRHY
ncbi:hypothetical protein C8F04DRAFT_166586 [Mycena alexandri]|uniref:Uncharacterized protein n=1 Tax=Mycena alexandri TaxID=1745969 RepID=A0AAD6SA04_9AGAR|nr:hypothetical protein C8F04DRAFT_166586 [Mycena alexandri]